MNGHYKTFTTKEKLENLAAQIPQAYRANALGNALALCQDGDPHEFERRLTGFVIWSLPALIEQDEQAAESAEISEWLGDPSPVVEWMREAEAAQADADDLRRTQEDALY